MTYKVVIVEDELHIREIMRSQIAASDDFEVIAELAHPSYLGGKIYGRIADLLTRILVEQMPSETPGFYQGHCLFVILDLSFSSQDEDYAIGLEVAAFLTQEYQHRERIRVLVATNHNNANFWSMLYELGIRVMAPKTKALEDITVMLEYLVRDQEYTGEVPIKSYAIRGEKNREVRVAELLAMGCSVSAIKNTRFDPSDPTSLMTAANTQKSTFSGRYIEHFVECLREELVETALNLPVQFDSNKHKVLAEWGDAVFLLYALRQAHPEVIKYVEQVCKIRITVTPTSQQGLFGVQLDDGPRLRK